MGISVLHTITSIASSCCSPTSIVRAANNRSNSWSSFAHVNRVAKLCFTLL